MWKLSGRTLFPTSEWHKGLPRERESTLGSSFHWTMNSKPGWSTEVDLGSNTGKKGHLDHFALLQNKQSRGVKVTHHKSLQGSACTDHFFLGPHTCVCRVVGLFSPLKNQSGKRTPKTISLLPFILLSWGE